MTIDKEVLPICFYLTAADLSQTDREKRQQEARMMDGPTLLHLSSSIPAILFFLILITSVFGALFLYDRIVHHEDWIKDHQFLTGVGVCLFIMLVAGSILAVIRTSRSPFRKYVSLTPSFLYQTLRDCIAIYPLRYVDDVLITHHYIYNRSSLKPTTNYNYSIITLFIGNKTKKIRVSPFNPDHATTFANLLLQNSQRERRQQKVGGLQEKAFEEQWIWQSLSQARLQKSYINSLRSPLYGILIGIMLSPAIYLGLKAYDQQQQNRVFQICQESLRHMQKSEYDSASTCFRYLLKFPHGRHVVEIEDLLFASLKQPRPRTAFSEHHAVSWEKSWEKSKEEKQQRDLQERREEYLKALPQGLHAKEIQALLDQQEAHIFAKAKATGQLGKYQAAFPKGKYLTQFPQLKNELFTKVLHQMQAKLPKSLRITKKDSQEERGQKIMWQFFQFLQAHHSREVPFVLQQKEASLSEFQNSTVPFDLDDLSSTITKFTENETAHALKQLLPYEILEPKRIDTLDKSIAGFVITYQLKEGKTIYMGKQQLVEALNQAISSHQSWPEITADAKNDSMTTLFYQELMFHFEVQVYVPGQAIQIFQVDATPSQTLFYHSKTEKNTTYSEMVRSALENFAPSLALELGLTSLIHDIPNSLNEETKEENE